MWIYVPTGQIIRFPKPVTLDDVQHPASIFTNWTQAELMGIGIYTFVEERYDQQRYWPGTAEDTIDGYVFNRKYPNKYEKDGYLDRVKEAKYAQVKIDIEALLAEGFTVAIGEIDFHMDCTEYHVGKLDSGLRLAELNGLTVMTLVDYHNGLHLDVPLADVSEMVRLLGNRIHELWSQKNSQRAAINAATTVEEVEAL